MDIALRKEKRIIMDTRAKAETLAKRPYLVMTTFEETTDDQPIYFARVLELEGCFGQGDTSEAAIEDLRLARINFIESLLEDGLPVPEPTRLVNTTLGAAAETTLTFVGQGNKLLKKRTDINRDAYIFSITYQ